MEEGPTGGRAEVNGPRRIFSHTCVCYLCWTKLGQLQLKLKRSKWRWPNSGEVNEMKQNLQKQMYQIIGFMLSDPAVFTVNHSQSLEVSRFNAKDAKLLLKNPFLLWGLTLFLTHRCAAINKVPVVFAECIRTEQNINHQKHRKLIFKFHPTTTVIYILHHDFIGRMKLGFSRINKLSSASWQLQKRIFE